jgi:hypothetical protein
MATDAPRAPRLTEIRLDDLDLAVKALNYEIAYLAGPNGYALYAPSIPLHHRLKDRHDGLVRARNWIAGKVAAERGQRAAEEIGA